MSEEREIDLVRVLYDVMKKWRGIIVFGIIIAIIAGGYKTITGLSVFYDSSKADEALRQYEIELNNYRAQGALLESTGENLRYSRDLQKEYNSKSVLMTIDANNEWVGSFSMYIDSGYRINPDVSYQDIDYTSRIISAYDGYYTDGDLFNYILDNTSLVSERKYLAEILTISVDFSSATVKAECIGASESDVSEILQLVKAYYNNKYTQVCDSIAEHTCSEVGSAMFTQVNEKLRERQKSNIAMLSEYDVEIAENENAYESWKKAGAPVHEYSAQRIATASIKYFILGGIVSVFIAFIWLACGAIFSRKISGYDIWKHLKIQVLGTVFTPKKAKYFLFVDRWINRLFAVPVEVPAKETSLELISESIKGIAGVSDNKRVAAVPAGSDELAHETAGLIGGADNVGNILENPSAIRKLREYDTAVLVVHEGTITYDRVERIIDDIKSWGIEILGVAIIKEVF